MTMAAPVSNDCNMSDINLIDLKDKAVDPTTTTTTSTTDKIKWEDLSIDEALGKLESTRTGLTQSDAESRLEQFGPNSLPSTVHNPLFIFLGFMWNPLSWAMEVAAIASLVLKDFPDFGLILFLLLLNAIIGYVEDRQAGNAVAALMGQLAPQSKILRDGEWRNLPACDIVTGDVIRIRLGDVVPADVKLLEGDDCKIDQSSLTGESLPVTKRSGDNAYSGSIVKQGEIEAVVHSTGVNTFFGASAALIDETESSGHLQQVLTTVGNFCMVSILIWVIIELIVVFAGGNYLCTWDDCPSIANTLVLIVGGIPVAMPTVLSVTMAIGAQQLARKDAIVTRLTAVEELAAMEILCSDKTGTLTLNKLSVDHTNLRVYNGFTPKDILLYGALAARIENNEPIDVCINDSYEEKDSMWDEFTLLHYTPFDPVNKKTVAKITENESGKVFHATKGAPQVILNLDLSSDTLCEQVNADILEFANRGYRALGVARSVDESDVQNPEQSKEIKWKLVGLIPLFDPPRHDTADTIRRARELGVDVKMITGDQTAIAIETARQLGMPTDIHDTRFFDQRMPEGISIDDLIEKCDGFAEVFPEHKYEIVKRLQNLKHVVGMTGDGVNDAPALKKADIGIAVDDATDAARAAADIVLLSPGLSVIIDAILGSRKIFQRMKNYALYSVASTVRIVFTFGLLTCIYEWYFPTIVIVIIALLNDGTIMTISKDRVTPSETPDSWKLREIFVVAIFLGLWLTLSSLILFQLAYRTDFFPDTFGLESFKVSTEQQAKFINMASKSPACNNDPECKQFFDRSEKMRGLIYLQVSVSGQALIFSTRSKKFCFQDRPAVLLILAFVIAQFIATIIGVIGFDWPNEDRTRFQGCGYYGIVVWVWCLLWAIPIDLIKMFVRFCISGKASKLYNRTTFSARLNPSHSSGKHRTVHKMSYERRLSRTESNLG